MCALSETKLKGNGEVMFGEVMGRVSEVAGWRVKLGVALLLSGLLLKCVVVWKEVSSRLMSVGVKMSERIWCLYHHMDQGIRRRWKSSGVS